MRWTFSGRGRSAELSVALLGRDAGRPIFTVRRLAAGGQRPYGLDIAYAGPDAAAALQQVREWTGSELAWMPRRIADALARRVAPQRGRAKGGRRPK